MITDQDRILLCKTIGLNDDFYFLPGGHIEHNESAKDTVLREIIEEFGDHDCRIIGFLGCLKHSFTPEHKMCHTHEYNLVFLVKSANLKAGQLVISLEKHIEFEWIEVDELKNINIRPTKLKELIHRWLEKNMEQAFESSGSE